MWITLTTDDVLSSLSGAEKTAVQTAAKAGGQGDPLAAIVSEITNEVRGYIAARTSNQLSATLTEIPDELKRAALARVRFEAFTRLPVGRSLLTEDRVAANDAAIALFRDVAAGRFSIVQPTIASTAAVASGNAVRLVRSGTARHDFSGLGGTY